MPATPATSPVLAVNKPSSLCCNIHAHDSCTPLRVPCCSHTAQERPAFCPSQVRRLMHSNTPLPSCPPPASQPYRTTDATCTTAGCSSAYRTPLALPPLVAGVSAQVVVPQLDVRHHLYRSWRYDAVRQRATIEQLLLPWRPGVALPHGSAFGETSTCMRCHSKGARRRYTSAPQCLHRYTVSWVEEQQKGSQAHGQQPEAHSPTAVIHEHSPASVRASGTLVLWHVPQLTSPQICRCVSRQMMTVVGAGASSGAEAELEVFGTAGGAKDAPEPSCGTVG